MEVSAGLLTTSRLLLLVGACGKSAQIPLYVWLPDAMAGPTPVSALIHAATMVTAGVYMVARSNAIFNHAPTALDGRRDHRARDRILRRHHRPGAERHQEGLRLLDGLAARLHVPGVRRRRVFGAAIFHLMTHAFFKALLFLGAGSVIHALDGEQDMRHMGGLREKIPWTFWTMMRARRHRRHPAVLRVLQQGRDSLDGMSSAYGRWMYWGRRDYRAA